MSKLSDYSKFDHLDEDDDEEQVIAKSSSPKEIQEIGVLSKAELPPQQHREGTTTTTATTTQQLKETSKTSDIPRFVVSFQGRRIYEWEQTLDSVTLFVPAPPFLKDTRSILCRITPNHLQLGLNHDEAPLLLSSSQKQQQQQQWYLDEDTFGTVDTHESCWLLEDNDDDDDKETIKKKIAIYLTKAHLGETWEAALRGNRRHQQNTGNERGSPPSTDALSMDPWTKQEIQRQLMLERFQQEHPGMDFRGATFNGGVPDPRTFLGGISHK